MKYALITGASAGIGKALSYKFAEKGHNIIITARRVNELGNTKKDIESRFKVNVIVKTGDLAEDGAASRLYDDLKRYDINILINNAGFGDFCMPWEINLEKANRMLNLNVKALTELSLKFVRDHVEEDATLINVSSVGGYYLFPIAVSYCATKFYVSSFTEGIAAAVKTEGKKLRAKVLAPGPTESEFLIAASRDAVVNGKDFFTDKNAFITAERLADYTYRLYESDKVVGIVDGEKKLILKDPVFQIFTSDTKLA